MEFQGFGVPERAHNALEVFRMDGVREIFQAKEVYLVGNERIRKSLEYIFPDVRYELKEEKTLNIEQMRVGVENSDIPIKQYLKKANFLSDCKKKIAIYGFGHVGKEWLGRWKEFYPGIEVSILIDNDSEKENLVWGGYRIVPFKSIEGSLKDFFFVICMNDYLDIFMSLKERGLDEGKDFVSWKTAFSDNSSLLYETLCDDARYSHYCKRPFGFLDVTDGGYFCCCPASVKGISLGNFDDQKATDILTSIRGRIFQLSILNKSYTFCDKNYCYYYDFCVDDTDEDFYIDIDESQPVSMLFGVDSSCNLSCPSCRNKVLNDKSAMHRYKITKIKEFMTEIGGNIQDLCLSGCGEPFFSRLTRHLMDSHKWRLRDSVSILCNGILLNEENFNRYLRGHKKINITISIDGATKKTYETLRRGGRFEVVMNNLVFLGELRVHGEISLLNIDFVLQSANIAELEKMRVLAHENHVDRINVLKVFDFGLLNDFDNLISVVDENKKCVKEKYKRYFTKEILGDQLFSWGVMADYIETVEKKESLYFPGYSIL